MDFKEFTPGLVVYWFSDDKNITSASLRQYAAEFFPKYDLDNEEDIEKLYYSMYSNSHRFPVPELSLKNLIQVQYDCSKESASRIAAILKKKGKVSLKFNN